jgi:exodeoxyribonuclease V alpha subunit
MVDDSKYGPTFEAEQAVRVIPDTIRGIQKYLEHHVKSIGKKTAAALMSKFGVAIINILDNSPERLTECAGIGADKADKIVASWRSQHDPVLRQLELWLARFDIPSVRQGCHYNPGEKSLPLHEAEWDRFQKGRRDGCPYGLAGTLLGTD